MKRGGSNHHTQLLSSQWHIQAKSKAWNGVQFTGFLAYTDRICWIFSTWSPLNSRELAENLHFALAKKIENEAIKFGVLRCSGAETHLASLMVRTAANKQAAHSLYPSLHSNRPRQGNCGWRWRSLSASADSKFKPAPPQTGQSRPGLSRWDVEQEHVSERHLLHQSNARDTQDAS